MRILSLIVLILSIIGCSTSEEQMQEEQLKKFNDYLGAKKAHVLDKTVDSFHGFLEKNYPTKENLMDQTFAFLEEFNSIHNYDSSWKWLNHKWIIDSETNEMLLKEWEESGLRQEVYLYGLELRAEGRGEPKYADTTLYSASERYKQALRDSSLFFNSEGDWISGLQKYSTDDPYMKEFVEMQYLMPVSSNALVKSFIENDFNLANPFIQRVIVTELYMPIVNEDLKRKNRTTTRQQW